MCKLFSKISVVLCKLFSKISVVLFSLIVFSGCSGIFVSEYVPPESCQEDGAYSLILKFNKDPRMLGKSLVLANVAALEAAQQIEGFDYDVPMARKIIAEIREYMKIAGMTYRELFNYAASLNETAKKKTGVALFLLDDELAFLNKDIPISQCDMDVIERNLVDQENILVFYE